MKFATNILMAVFVSAGTFIGFVAWLRIYIEQSLLNSVNSWIG